MTITRTSETRYSVVTDTVLADGTLRADFHMALVGGALRSTIEPGSIRIGGLMVVRLGPVSRAAVDALAVGESVTMAVQS